MNIERVKAIVDEVCNMEYGYFGSWSVWDQGRLAYAAGMTLEDCPCTGQDHVRWCSGFQQENYYEKNGETKFEYMTEEELLVGLERMANGE